MMPVEPILKAMKFGRERALRVLDHQETCRSFYWRQTELALVAVVQLVFFVFCGEPTARIFFVCLALLCITCGEREARRMRACGRYHQCNRSIAVIGI